MRTKSIPGIRVKNPDFTDSRAAFSRSLAYPFKFSTFVELFFGFSHFPLKPYAHLSLVTVRVTMSLAL